MINKLYETKDYNIKPKWFLRQSGRHIPEYFNIRNKHNTFINFCLDEQSIVEATLLPLKYYNIEQLFYFPTWLILL